MTPRTNGEKPENKDWTDSERATLREVIEERQFEKQLDMRKERVVATVKATAQWVAAVIGGFVILKDSLQGAWKWFTHWIAGGQ